MNAYCPDDCLSTSKDTSQVSERMGNPSNLANDYDGLTTYSCTLADVQHPWWAVDLGADYHVSHVVLTLPDVGGDDSNY